MNVRCTALFAFQFYLFSHSQSKYNYDMRSDVNFSTYMAVLTYSMLTLWIHDKGMLTLECLLPIF